MTEDIKCAPNKKYRDASCFTLDDLQLMAESYNNLDGNLDKINISNNKKKLVNQITNKLDNVCSDQICWLRQKFVRNLKNDEINKNTFRPVGPEGKNDWLSTVHINEVMAQYEKKYNDFKFYGAVPIDFDEISYYGIKNMDLDKLYNDGIRKIGFVFNLDESWQSGSHWVSLFIDLKNSDFSGGSKNKINLPKIYFFDSYAIKPEKRIRKLMQRIGKWCYKKIYCNNSCDLTESQNSDKIFKNNKTKIEKKINIEYSRIRHQRGGSECGVYSIEFILNFLEGKTLDDFNKKRIPDELVNLERNKLFRFKNNPFK